MGRRITTHDILEKDLGTVVMEALQKKEKPVFENEVIETVYNILSTICSNIDIPVEGITETVLRISSEVYEKTLIREAKYLKKIESAAKQNKKIHALTPTHLHKDTSHIHTFTCKHTHIHTYTHTHLHAHTSTHIHTYTHSHLLTFTRTPVTIHTNTPTHLHPYTHTRTQIRIHTITYKHARIHTFTHTRTHTYSPSQGH